jgi:hypothetical protein
VTWALATAATGPHIELLEIARPSLEQYADTWGMHLVTDIVVMGSDPATPPSWLKIPLLGDLLTRHDGVLWVDADAMFLRFDVDIRTVAPKDWNWVYNEYGPEIAPWHRPPPMVAPCAGVLALRPKAQDLLDAVWKMRSKYLTHPWWEQAAAHELFGWCPEWPDCRWRSDTPHTPRQGPLPREWDSTPADPHPNPIIFHASGIPLAERAELMTMADQVREPQP